jgi:glycosyltransferase involved in cell wall biosynthesis
MPALRHEKETESTCAGRGERIDEFMKILIVASWFPSKDSSVSGIFIAEQARALASTHKVTVLDLSIGAQGSQPHRSAESLGNHTVVHLTIPARRMVHSLDVARAIAAEAEAGKFDLIHAHVTLPAGFASVLAGMMSHRPVVITEHFAEFDAWMKSWRTSLKVRFSLSRAHAVIAVSESLARQMRSFRIRRPIQAIPNLIDSARFSLQRAPNGTDETFNLLFVGRLCEDKNLSVLLRALRRLCDRNGRKYRLKIVGDGPLAESYLGLARDLHLGSACEFTRSFYEPDRIAREMAACHVLVLPSRKETFGVVVAEAMAVGRPVVATRCGGPEEILTEKTGILVPVDDASAFAEAIDEVCRRYGSFRPEVISDYAHRHFGSGPIVDRLTQIYANVSGQIRT